MKEWEIYTGGPDGPTTHLGAERDQGNYEWTVWVRAKSMKEAKALLASQAEATGDAPGVVRVDRAAGPGHWPWDMDEDKVADWNQ